MDKVNVLKQTKNKLLNILGDSSCLICYEDFNTNNKIPIMICMQQHNCCPDCAFLIQKCPLCRNSVDKYKFTRNRLKFEILQQIKNIDQEIKECEEEQLLEMYQYYENNFQDYQSQNQQNNCQKYFKMHLKQDKKKLANFQIRRMKTTILQPVKKKNNQNYTIAEV